jgi:maltooligosyltrehalose trehalohydrolase
VPLVFQGEEFGATAPFPFFADFADDRDLSRAVTEGRRREFASLGWKPEEIPDPVALATFARAKLDWNELLREPHRGLFQWYRQLVQLRRRLPQLSDGRLDRVATAYSADDQWLVVERSDVTIATNFARDPRAIPIRAGRPCAVLLCTHEGGIAVERDRVMLPASALVVLGPESHQGNGWPR